jgi:phosphate transport system substrate-binding protein
MIKINWIAGMALVLGFIASSSWAAEPKLTLKIKGSDTMVHLASAWAEKFMQVNPDVEISVTGGGSGTGIAALLNGNADIATSSRSIKPEEINMAKGKGFAPVEWVVGQDGLSIIVNPANPVKTLTLEQLKKIFTGEVNNWKVFGGDDQKIGVFSRDSSSGTYVFFQEHVLNKLDYSVRARRLASNSALVQSVSEDTNAIAYVGLGYAEDAKDKVKIIPIQKNPKSPAVMPNITTVKDKSYPVARNLQMYTRGEAVGAAKRFIDFVLSPAGQKILEELGFVKK